MKKASIREVCLTCNEAAYCHSHQQRGDYRMDCMDADGSDGKHEDEKPIRPSYPACGPAPLIGKFRNVILRSKPQVQSKVCCDSNGNQSRKK
jgi:hypothetical protein